METIIKTIKEKIKSLEWDCEYHDKKLREAQEALHILAVELDELQEKTAHETLT